MKLLFLLPDIQGIPTGGNIFNTKMMHALQATCVVHQAVWTPTASLEALLAPAYDWVFIDSLLVEQLDVATMRKFAGPKTRWAVLVHYLPFFDPYQEEAKADVSSLLAYDLFVTTSTYSKKCLMGAGIAAEQIAVVYPGLDAAHRTTKPVKEQGREVHLLTVSSLLPGKGLSQFVEVLDSLADHSVHWRWQLVGDDGLDPAYAAALFAQMKASDATNRMSWRGPLAPAQMPACYREADLFVLPSRFETLGMAVREAMAAGVPVVAFDVGGIHESLSDGAGVMLVPFNYSEMEAVLAELLENAGHRETLGQRAKTRSRQFPSWEASAATLVTFLK